MNYILSEQGCPNPRPATSIVEACQENLLLDNRLNYCSALNQSNDEQKTRNLYISKYSNFVSVELFRFI